MDAADIASDIGADDIASDIGAKDTLNVVGGGFHESFISRKAFERSSNNKRRKRKTRYF